MFILLWSLLTPSGNISVYQQVRCVSPCDGQVVHSGLLNLFSEYSCLLHMEMLALTVVRVNKNKIKWKTKTIKVKISRAEY